MADVAFVDTTLRDGQQSLWAMRMKTSMILPVTEAFARAGLEAAEIVSTAFPRKLIKELRDDPWERVRLVARRLPDLPLRMIMSRHVAGFQLTPRALARLCVERAAANGIRQVRVSDPSNTIPLLRERVADLRDVGIDSVINLIYSLSPKHTDAYYAARARDARDLRPAAICIKDPGGLLTPERTRTIVPAVLESAGDVPVEFHTHCNTGLGPLCCLEAVRLGVRVVHTAVPPLANASSNPSVYNVADNLRALGYGVKVDAAALRPAEEHFTRVALREGFPLGAPAEYDASYYRHQVPGGMISNLRYQLSRLGIESQLPNVLEEAARVREDLGFPIMVTPYSQFVGTQATLNIVTGRRYGEVTDELIHYALGLWGEEERTAILPEVRDRILDRARAEQLSRWTPPEPSIEDIRRTHGGPGVSDDDLYLRYLMTPADLANIRPVDPDEYLHVERPISMLVREIALRRGIGAVRLEKPGLVLHWQTAPRRATAGSQPSGGGAGSVPSAAGSSGEPVAAGGAGEPSAAGGAGEPSAAGRAGEPVAAGRGREPVAAGSAGDPVAAGSAGDPVAESGAGEPVAAGGSGEPPAAGGAGEPVAASVERREAEWS